MNFKQVLKSKTIYIIVAIIFIFIAIFTLFMKREVFNKQDKQHKKVDTNNSALILTDEIKKEYEEDSQIAQQKVSQREQDEQKILRKFTNLFSRSNDEYQKDLLINFQNGKSKKYQDIPYDGSDSVVFYQVDNYYPEIKSLEVVRGYYEGYDTFLVSLVDGKETDLYGPLLFSPKKSKFLSYFGEVYGMGNTPNGLMIFEINPGGSYKKIYDKYDDFSENQKESTKLDFIPVDIRWVSEDRLEITKEYETGDGLETKKEKVLFDISK